MKITADRGRARRTALGVGAAGAVVCLIAAGLMVAGPAGADPSNSEAARRR